MLVDVDYFRGVKAFICRRIENGERDIFHQQLNKWKNKRKKHKVSDSCWCLQLSGTNSSESLSS